MINVAIIFLKIEIVLFLSDMKVNTTCHSILRNNHWRHFGSSLSRPYTVNTVIKHVRWTRLPHHVFPGGLHSLCREVVGNLTIVSLLQMSLLDVPLPSWATTSAHVAVQESGLWSPPARAWEEVLGWASFPLGPWPFPPPPSSTPDCKVWETVKRNYSDLPTNVHGSIIQNSQKVETAQVSCKGWMEKQNVA